MGRLNFYLFILIHHLRLLWPVAFSEGMKVEKACVSALHFLLPFSLFSLVKRGFFAPKSLLSRRMNYYSTVSVRCRCFPFSSFFACFFLSFSSRLSFRCAGIGYELLESVNIPSADAKVERAYNVILMEKLLRILFASCQYGEFRPTSYETRSTKVRSFFSCAPGSKVRLVTLDLVIMLIKSLVIEEDGKSALADNHFAEVEGVREESTLLLRNFYKVEYEK